VPRKLIGTDGFQETPIVEVTRAITKHNYLVMDIADLPRVVKEVWRVGGQTQDMQWGFLAVLAGQLLQCRKPGGRNRARRVTGKVQH
jgi:hypothetical protein